MGDKLKEQRKRQCQYPSSNVAQGRSRVLGGQSSLTHVHDSLCVCIKPD